MKKQILNARGFTLIEIIVALAIVSIVMLIVSNFFLNMNQAFIRANKQSDIQYYARQTMDDILSDIRYSSEVTLLNIATAKTEIAGSGDYNYIYIESGVVHLSTYNLGTRTNSTLPGTYNVSDSTDFFTKYDEDGLIIHLKNADGDQTFPVDSTINLPNLNISGSVTGTSAQAVKYKVPNEATAIASIGIPDPSKVTITFNSDGGTDVSSITAIPGTPITAPAPPTKSEFTFAGWSPSLPSLMPSSDRTYTALWTPIAGGTFTLSFYSDGVLLNSNSVTSGAPITAPADPVKFGYEFAGWSPALPSTMPANDLTVNAQWQKLYTVTFEINGGDSSGYPKSATTASDGTVALPTPDPTKSGSSFVGWNTKKNSKGTPFTSGSVVTGNMTVYAQWS